jgi:hypothetical protein
LALVISAVYTGMKKQPWLRVVPYTVICWLLLILAWTILKIAFVIAIFLTLVWILLEVTDVRINFKDIWGSSGGKKS